MKHTQFVMLLIALVIASMALGFLFGFIYGTTYTPIRNDHEKFIVPALRRNIY